MTHCQLFKPPIIVLEGNIQVSIVYFVSFFLLFEGSMVHLFAFIIVSSVNYFAFMAVSSIVL